MIALTALSILVLATNVRPASSLVGLVKSDGSPQPYEPAGPFVDGIMVPSYLVNQDNEWAALKSGAIDVYDWPMRPSQNAEWNNNICVAAPDVTAGYTPQPGDCPAGQAHIQTEIAKQNAGGLDKYEIDFQNAKFPSNVQAFRWAIAWITDKENFTTKVMGGLGFPPYSAIPCPTLCDPVTGQWVDPSLLTPIAEANHVYGSGLPISTRIATANAILDAAGFGVGGGGVRINNRVGCSSDPGGCGAPLTPFFYVRDDDPERLHLGRQVDNIMKGTYCATSAACAALPPGTAGLAIQMIPGCTGNSGSYPYANNYCEPTGINPPPQIFQFNFNMYTAGWGLSRDPTFLDSLYDSRFTSQGNNNYVNYNDSVFDAAARQLTSAATISDAVSAAHAAEIEYNKTLPVLEVYTHNAPLAYRIFHSDPDPTLNGLQWAGFQLGKGLGYHNGWSWLNAQLLGAPLHDPAHQIFLKFGFKTDILDSPNPIDSDFAWDQQAFSLSFDSINIVASDDLSFAGDLPWMASLPITTNIASGGMFPDRTTCTPDAPATGCSVLSYTLRPDMTFASALDGSIPAISVNASDVAFSILLGRDSPTSFVVPSYVHVQNVRVIDATHFQVEERNQAVWDKHDIGGTIVISRQHWCVEAHGSWLGTSVANCAPPWTAGFPDHGVNVVGVGSSDAFGTGPPSRVDMGSFAFVYDSQASSAQGGPTLFRTRQTPGEPLPSPYVANAPNDDYFTSVYDPSRNGGWERFHNLGNVNWQCIAAFCISSTLPGGTAPSTLPWVIQDATCLTSNAPDNVINIKDLTIVALHFGTTPGLDHHCYLGDDTLPWDVSGVSPGSGDGKVDILDLAWVAIHMGQTFPPAVGMADTP